MSIKELALGLTEPQIGERRLEPWRRSCPFSPPVGTLGGVPTRELERVALGGHLPDLRDQSRVSGAVHTFRS